MSAPKEEKLKRFKPLRFVALLLQKVILPGFGGLSLYDLQKIYLNGIVKGAFSARAGSVAFSFIMAIFPAMLFLLNLIPYVPIEGFDTKFLNFIFELMPSQSEAYFKPIVNDIFHNRRCLLYTSPSPRD